MRYINLGFAYLLTYFTTTAKHSMQGRRKRSPISCNECSTPPPLSSLVSDTRKFDRGLSALGLLHDELHWLDVPERIMYKLAVMVYRWLPDQTPRWRYLADHLPLCLTVSVPRRAFAIAGATVWHSLPDELKEIRQGSARDSGSFKQFLKTTLFTNVTSAFGIRGFS